jgi:hypothetical protein
VWFQGLRPSHMHIHFVHNSTGNQTPSLPVINTTVLAVIPLCTTYATSGPRARQPVLGPTHVQSNSSGLELHSDTYECMKIECFVRPCESLNPQGLKMLNHRLGGNDPQQLSHKQGTQTRIAQPACIRQHSKHMQRGAQTVLLTQGVTSIHCRE